MVTTKIVFEISRDEFKTKESNRDIYHMIKLLENLMCKFNFKDMSISDVKILKSKFVLSFKLNRLYIFPEEVKK